MIRTIQEINAKIKQGQAVVVTAAEIIKIARAEGTRKATEKVDVVTTGTFGPMCSSGAYFNIGHAKHASSWEAAGLISTMSGLCCFCRCGPVYRRQRPPDDDPATAIIPVISTMAAAMSSRTWWRPRYSAGGLSLRH